MEEIERLVSSVFGGSSDKTFKEDIGVEKVFDGLSSQCLLFLAGKSIVVVSWRFNDLGVFRRKLTLCRLFVSMLLEDMLTIWCGDNSTEELCSPFLEKQWKSIVIRYHTWINSF